MKTKTLRLLIVDDHFAVRKGLAASIGTQSDLETVAEASTAGEAIEAYEEHRPDAVLMDLRLPDQSGHRAIAVLCERHPEACIVVFSSFSTEEDIRKAVKAGARGFVDKNDSWETLADSIREVCDGGYAFPREISGRLTKCLTRPRLSRREREVLLCVSRGFSNKEVASELGVTEMTVKTHLHHIFEKLSVHDRMHAVYIASRRGLLRLE